MELFSFLSGRQNCPRETVFRFTCAVLWWLHGYHRIFDKAVRVCDCIYSGNYVCLFVNNNDSSYLMIFTSLLHVVFDRINDSNLTFKTTKNPHAKSTFMLPPYFFLGAAVLHAPTFSILESPLTADGLCHTT